MRNLGRSTILILSLLVSMPSLSQVLSWQWAYAGNGPDNDGVTCICSDTQGNLYFAGYFPSSSFTFHGVTLNCPGPDNIFIFKCDPQGNPIWYKNIGGVSGAGKYPMDMTVDHSDNLLVTGYYGGNGLTLDSIFLQNNGDADAFVAKYDANGNILWAKSYGDALYEMSMSIVANKNDEYFVSGTFSSSSVPFDTVVLSNSYYGCGEQIFLLKLNSSGNVLWATQAGGYGTDHVYDMCLDTAGDVYLTGSVNSTYPIGFDTITVNNSGGKDIYIAKYSSNGRIRWVKNTGSSIYGTGKSIAAGKNGQIIFTGTFYGAETFETVSLPSAGSKDVFVASYDTAGNFLWVISFGSAQNDEGNAICTNAAGKIAVTGYHEDKIAINTGDTIRNKGIFLMEVDQSGNLLWHQDATNNAICGATGTGICNGANGDLYVCGNYLDSLILIGADTLLNAYFNPSSGGCYSDVFIAKLGNETTRIIQESRPYEVSAFPNPATEMLRISGYSAEFTFFEITTNLGQPAMSGKLGPNSTQLNVSGLVQDVYILKLSGNSGSSVTHRVLILKN